MAKRFSKKYRNKGWASTTCILCQDACQCLMLHPYITSLPPKPSSIFYYPKLNSNIGHYEAFSQSWVRVFVMYMPSPFYPSRVVLFQLHGGMVNHMQVLNTHFSIVHITKYLDLYLWNHTSCSCLFLRQWCRDVASGADRHLDIWIAGSLRSLLVSLLFREAFSHPYISSFSFTSKWFFCY